ncbi:PTS glucose transporter subunit IIA [Bacillus sp. V3-13]|uniref:PTS sugar transporter subunit IIA n=1 Tax=Bacillus sp. V3-13 TaxID=2053728 RepID=UPI000C76AC57|nr:PTS glucose transporter subunit IIA [Bacillus sp. V3-13]PLR75416.1 PTS glucose transporter subunit IIA [Bacillus sp. V3-13]
MLNSLFRKKIYNEAEEITAPLDGEMIPLDDVPDPVFAQKMMGDGFAIIPKNGKVVSPVNGRIIQIFPTKHAIGIRSDKGLEILIHIGLETVELNGEGFEVIVRNNQPVRAGEVLLNVDLEFLEKKNKEIVTPIIITNMDRVQDIEQVVNRDIKCGEIIAKCHVKNSSAASV